MARVSLMFFNQFLPRRLTSFAGVCAVQLQIPSVSRGLGWVIEFPTPMLNEIKPKKFWNGEMSN